MQALFTRIAKNKTIMTTTENIKFIKLPESFKADLGSFSIDPSIELPILLGKGKDKVEDKDQ